MKKLLLLLPTLVILTGCASYGTVTKNLATDGAIVKLKIGTPWGVQDVLRIGSTTNSVEIDPDGTVRINPR